MRQLPCSTCSKIVDLNNVKYYSADQQHVFCDAYCSHAWYTDKKVKQHNLDIMKAQQDEIDGK